MKISENLNKDIESEINNICIKNKNNNKNILILSGGGIKGITILGALKYLEDNNIIDNIDIYAGTSIGALINILLIIGYKSSEIYKFSEIFDMINMIDININNILSKYSINNDDNFILVCNKLLESKNINPKINLLDFYKKTKKKLICVTACLTTKTAEYISYDNYPDLELNTLIRMTTAVPILFSPIIYKNKVYIDGGLIDNFPINLFEDNLTNVIGINLKSDYFKNTEINNIIDYFVSILQILSNRITNKYDFEKYKNIIYTIDISISNPFNFTLTKEIKKELFYKGYNFMKDNFIHHLN